MLGPHGTSEHPTKTPCLIACLIVGVSGPPSFGPTNQALYFFETRASRSCPSCLLVLNCASNTVSLTLGFCFWMSFAPRSSASQYVFADEARKTPMLIVFLWLPAAVEAIAAVIAPAMTITMPANASPRLILASFENGSWIPDTPWDPRGLAIVRRARPPRQT